MKKLKETRWSKTTIKILEHTSALALLIRDADSDSLKDVATRLQQFGDAWLVTGDGDVLPCSGKNADVGAVLADVDVADVIKDICLERMTWE